MSFLRRGSPAPEGDEDDSAVAEDLDTSDNGAPVADQQPASPPQSERQQKSGQRATRMDLIRQARKASAGMEDPEPVRGLMVAGFLAAVGLFSFFSKDVQQVSHKLNGKTTVVNQLVPPHPPTAMLLVVVALASAGTIYWRRRYVTSIAFMISAAVGIGTPFPKGLSDLMWLTFLVPAGYVLWVLMFRMNKQQKAWLAAHGASSQGGGGGGGGSSGSSSKRQAQRSQQASTSSRSRKAKPETPTSNATGRALPENSGRYTRPKSKPPAGQRRS